MVLWEDKQNWKTSGQTHKEKKEESNKIRNEKGEVTTHNEEI